MRKIQLIILIVIGNVLSCYSNIAPYDLRCEYLVNPLGIDLSNPRLFWKCKSNLNNQYQSAYHILVASSELNLDKNIGDFWDTKKVNSDHAAHITYEGLALKSGLKVYWKVKVWDSNGNESGWSAASCWTMGLLNENDWKAKWIGMDKNMEGEQAKALHPILTARALRKTVDIKKQVASAMLYISAAGLYEFHINGKKVGNAVLAPALSQTEKRFYYNTYDVSKLIAKGINVFTSYLGAGRWTSLRPLQETTGEWQTDVARYKDTLSNYKPRYPRLLAQIEVQYSDGTKEILTTDETWKISSAGPITRNNEYDGEDYDATREFKGWQSKNYDDRGWYSVQAFNFQGIRLSSENKESIEVVKTLKPISIKKWRDNVYIADMGQNMVGWCKIYVKGKRGEKIQLRFAELLKPDGSLYLDNMRTAEVTDRYTLKGDPDGESWEPRFTYHGFRYVEISNYSGLIDTNSIEGRVVHDAVESIGTFECSQPIMNKLHHNAYWGISGNYRGMPTDCPQRDERFAWLGDRAMETKGESFLFKNINLYTKWLQDIRDAQLPNGSIPDVAPTHTGMISLYNDGVVWPSCFVILPHVMYQQHGDVKIIENNYDAMFKWIKLMLSYKENGLMNRNTYGDWCVPPEAPDLIFTKDPNRQTSGVLLSSAYLYLDLKLMSIYAKILGKKSDADFFVKEMQSLKDAINTILFNNKTYKFDNNSLSSSIVPLGVGIVSEADRTNVFKNTIQKLIIDHDLSMGTGLIGGQWLMKVLSENERSDLAYQLALNTKYPSWGYQIEKGATTIWELWNGDKARPDMNSGNHVMLLGDVITWMYEKVAGIASDTTEAGFKRIVMNPDFSEKLSFAKASYQSIYGQIESHWRTENNRLIWNITIPPNTKALVYIPSEDNDAITVNAKKAMNAEGIRYISKKGEKSLFEFSSGKHEILVFGMKYPQVKPFVLSPQISPSDTSCLQQKPIWVKISSPTEDAKIYYTTDGSEPNENAILYSKPFQVSTYKLIKAKAYKTGYEVSPAVLSTVDIYSPDNGWAYKYYEGKWTKLLDFSKETIIASGFTYSFNFEKIKKREDYWGAVFQSKIEINNSGEHIFFISSDDGSRLKINGKNVAEVDGVHGLQTGIGKISLQKGIHDIEIEYFDGNYGEALRLEWIEPNGTKVMVPIHRLIKKE